MNLNLEKLKWELMCQKQVRDKPKDILIVVHNQFKYLKYCIESIKNNTNNYNLYIWDNASDKKTKRYLEKLNINLISSNKNLGFIIPNNTLASLGKSQYIILLNSDTYVKDGWDQLMLGILQEKPEYWLVGYLGGILDKDGKGKNFSKGEDIDFVHGWCMCFTRDIFRKYGLFDDQNLEFAFAEDADFSLRLRESGGILYACYAEYVYHYGNKTIKEVQDKYTLAAFVRNHDYVKERWKKFLPK